VSQTPDQWERVQELFDAVFDLSPEARSQYLQQQCGGDIGLRSQVEGLFASAGITQAFHDAVWTTIGDAAAPQPGAQIGPYHILREIGQGGMGAVYLAVRADDHFRKQVAIKLLNTAFPSPRMLSRFKAERQIVADLEHPCIARILDGGATENGAPYLVMEYVDGVPLSQFDPQRKLPLVRRLQLFLQICEAVSYAHRKLVVHRDIKPGNILVTADGTPKLVDFGIAKLLTDADTLPAATTELILTPEYASPEQIRNESITTATDVYALGVVLYEWLTAKRPYEVRSLTPGEMERAICQTNPVKPSLAAAEPKAGRSLRGDLDTIVLTAMRKEPARRYASVDRLSDDIRRYLEGLPISARPDTWSYRTRKFIRRHTLAVSAAALLVTLLIAFSTAMAVLAARLARERNMATDQAARTEQISQFLLNLFKVSDPSEARGNSITAREILDRGAERISGDLKRQPHVQAAMLDTMGGVYEGLGLYTRAQALYENSLAVRQAARAPAIDVAQSDFNIARELEIRDLDYPRAESLARQALAVRRARFGGHSLEVADCLELLGNLARSEGKLDQAYSDLSQALSLKRDLSGAGSLPSAQAAYDFARIVFLKGDLPQASTLFQQTLAIRQKQLPAGDPLILESMEAVAFIWQSTGNLSGAEDYLSRVLAGRRKLYGPLHYGVAVALDNLASVLQDEGKISQAEADYRQAIDTGRKTIGEWTRSTAITINDLATLLRDRGDYAEAETAFRESIAIYRKTIGSDHADTALALGNLALTLLHENKLAEADQAGREALAIQRKRLAPDSPALARTLRTLGQVHQARNDNPGALSDYREALLVARKRKSPDPALLASILLPYGSLLQRLRKPAEAQPLLQSAFDTRAKLLGTEAEQTAEAEEQLGLCLTSLRQFADAESHLRHAHRVLRVHAARQ